MAAPLTRQISHLRLYPCQVSPLRKDVLHQQFACRVQAHTPWHALKDRRAKVLLESLNAPVEGRSGDIHIFGGFAN